MPKFSCVLFQEVWVVLVCLLGLYMTLISSINTMIRSSPAYSRKKNAQILTAPVERSFNRALLIE